ncbi:MAG: putative F420-dependent oxidoreductase [Solirubrobacterales bacterium]|nr:putative F420-dependent oxidoreductase [Solirubrobacterales bacterium]
MRISLHLAYWGVGPGAHELAPVAREAERLGYDCIWIGEAYGSDVATCLAWVAAATQTISIGSAIAQIPARSPTATAMMAASLDTLSGGRLRLGIGPSGPQVAQGWYGQPFNPQLQRTREYVELVRRTLRREPAVSDGELYPLPTGGQRPLKLITGPVQEQIPVYLPAIGPKSTHLVGEIADGWLPIFVAPEHLAEQRAELDAGLAAAGRPQDAVAIAPTAYGRIDPDPDAARDALRPVTALYTGGMGSREKNFYNALMRSYGFADDAGRVQDLYLGGKKAEAEAALPAAFIDMVGLCGTEADVARRLAEHAAAGVDELLISIIAEGLEDRLEQLRRFARAASLPGAG